MTIKQTVDSVIDVIRQRVRNPFIGAFVISWCVVNIHSILILILSESSIEQRLKVFKFDVVNWIDIPFVSAIAIIIITNILNLFVQTFVIWVDTLIAKVKDKKENELLSNKLKLVEKRMNIGKLLHIENKFLTRNIPSINIRALNPEEKKLIQYMHQNRDETQNPFPEWKIPKRIIETNNNINTKMLRVEAIESLNLVNLLENGVLSFGTSFSEIATTKSGRTTEYRFELTVRLSKLGQIWFDEGIKNTGLSEEIERMSDLEQVVLDVSFSEDLAKRENPNYE